MREMKDSGIEWVGAIPAAWGVHRIASHFQEIKEKNTVYRVYPTKNKE